MELIDPAHHHLRGAAILAALFCLTTAISWFMMTDGSVIKKERDWMPRRPEQNAAIRAAQRQAILRAALPLFARNGIDGTPVTQIARAAGVAHGTVFLYFPTKEELAAAVLTESLGTLAQRYLTVLNSDGSPLERIEHFVRFALTTVMQERDLLLFAIHILAHWQYFSALSPHLFQFSNRLTQALAQVIQEGQEAGQLGPGDPDVTAWTFFAFLQGIPLTFIHGPENNPYWEKTLNRAMLLFQPIAEGGSA
jgi:AcrR family transcriptional regulator